MTTPLINVNIGVKTYVFIFSFRSVKLNDWCPEHKFVRYGLARIGTEERGV